MDFNQFKQSLTKRLSSPLPGVEAQLKMAPRPVSQRRFEEDPESPARPSGVLILLYPENGGISLPLTKRPTYAGAHSGQVSFPGGKFELSDQSLTETALRETEEEIGVDRSRVEVIGELSELFVIASNFKITPSVGVISGRPDFIPDPREVEGVLNVSLDHLSNTSNQGVERMRFGEYSIDSPYYNVNGNIVWGATAMMLSELLTITASIQK